jgi:monothiol glutaredoxin
MSTSEMTEDVQKRLAEMVRADKVVLFMKGNRHFPQCGFSAAVVKILDSMLPSYKTVNVLADPSIRDGVKAFSQWPTIPQLYVNGEFVGGCDIVRELFESGELQTLLGAEAAPQGAAAGRPAAGGMPRVTLTEGAAAAFRGAFESPGDCVRLEIGAGYELDLTVDQPAAGDVVLDVNGIKIAMDPASASRADGVRIDFVPGASGGFKIDNPNAPARAPAAGAPGRVKPLAVTELKAMMDRGDAVELFDVRTSAERERATIAGARHFDAEAQRYLESLDKNAKVVFHCHHGGRSRAAAERAVALGFRDVYNLEGGIDAWSQKVDPKVPRY